jgi:hypothetical protein
MEYLLRNVYILSLSCLERSIIASFFCLVYSTNFISRWFFTLCIYIANLFVYFASVNNKSYEKTIGSTVGFYCIQSIDWMIAWMIILCLQSHWEIPSYGNRCGNKSFLRTFQKEIISIYCRSVSLTLFVAFAVLHNHNNNPQC